LTVALSPDRIQWFAWTVTLFLESAGAAAWWTVARVSHPSLHRALGSVLAVNAVTHPIFWFALRRLTHPGPTAVLLAEAIVIGVEAALYAWLWSWPPLRAVGLSAALNLFSWLGGILLWQWSTLNYSLL